VYQFGRSPAIADIIYGGIRNMAPPNEPFAADEEDAEVKSEDAPF
jgi:hypothetical protein